MAGFLTVSSPEPDLVHSLVSLSPLRVIRAAYLRSILTIAVTKELPREVNTEKQDGEPCGRDGFPAVSPIVLCSTLS